MVVGRRRHNDPEPIAVVEGESMEHRLLVAPRDEVRVSRNRLRLERISRHRIRLTSISRHSEVLVDNQEKLLAGDTIIRKCPVRIQLYGCECRLDKA